MIMGILARAIGRGSVVFAAGALLALAQTIDTPEPGKEIYWIAGLMAAALVALFWQLLTSKGQQIDDWKIVAKSATAELVKTVDSLRAVTDAVERHGRDTTAALTRNGEAVVGLAGDVRKLTDALVALERRMDRLDASGRHPPRDGS